MPVLKFSLGGNIREGESIHPFILNQTTRVHTQTAHKPHIHKQNVVKSTLQTTEKKSKRHEVHHIFRKLCHELIFVRI